MLERKNFRKKIEREIYEGENLRFLDGLYDWDRDLFINSKFQKKL